ncbi:MAG: AraC family transcriptional regulator [Pedobacter sp.]|nr:MAG: AraC family transcriptional regulator [Pedobacter sp.]
MHILNDQQQVPVYSLEPDDIAANKQFRVYNFDGNLPSQSDLLVPHRKDHYLIVFIRRAGGTRQWIDMAPYTIQDNTVYFTGPNQIIVKEGFNQLWSTGIAFTKEFLSFQENASLSKLPLLQNPQNVHELRLTEADVNVVEDMLAKINGEYRQPGEWQQRMLTAYLTVLLTYLSRLYTEQYKPQENSPEKTLLRSYQSKVNESFRELKEVGAYASQLNISAGHLSEVVKMQSGKPAIKHIHERVVLEARRLLFHTNDSLKEIAFDLGFSDASYFNRFFRRETEVTPAEYRTKIREMYH